jgi:hypothetical protein
MKKDAKKEEAPSGIKSPYDFGKIEKIILDNTDFDDSVYAYADGPVVMDNRDPTRGSPT